MRQGVSPNTAHRGHFYCFGVGGVAKTKEKPLVKPFGFDIKTEWFRKFVERGSKNKPRNHFSNFLL